MLAEAWTGFHPLQIVSDFGGGGTFPRFPPGAATVSLVSFGVRKLILVCEMRRKSWNNAIDEVNICNLNFFK